jgi:hypothetical protein
MERAGFSADLIGEVSTAITSGDIAKLSSLVPEKVADFNSAIDVVKGDH